MTNSFLVAAALVLSLAQLGNAAVLDEDVIEVSRTAVEVCASLELEDNPFTSFPQATFYVDEPDAALFLREGNYCIAAFRGTKPNTADWYRNLDPFDSPVCSPSNECCTTRNGFSQSYSTPDFKTNLEADIRSCKNSCPGCKVVLTGHSTGGSIATVASILLADCNPHVVTFGQPGTLINDCPAIDTDKYIRYSNTEVDSQGVLRYDPVSSLNVFGTDHFGNLVRPWRRRPERRLLWKWKRSKHHSLWVVR